MASAAGELQSLIETEIPDGRHQLESSYANLERVAAFCEANYLQSSDKQAALEETRRYTVQSLASVAYQINTLASNLLQMLDLQTDKISEMETQVNNIAQIVDIHKEKVARREIGVLTTNKVVPRLPKIVAPAQTERPQRYQRSTIDFSILDELGHGVKLGGSMKSVGRTGSTVSAGSSGSGGGPWNFDQQHHFISRPAGSLSKATGKEYRAPMTIVPPPAPFLDSGRQTYMGDGEDGSIQRTMSGGYTAVSVGYAPTRFLDEHLPPPPSPGSLDVAYKEEQHSPPLPPPPMMESGDSLIPEMPQYGSYVGRFNERASVPDWVPSVYVEKVIAIYDYDAEKPDELSFLENSLIYVLKKNEDGWYEGVLDGLTGLFPGNYVEPCL